MFRWLRTLFGGFRPPKPIGPPVRFRALGPSDAPRAATAQWEGIELRVRSDEAASVRLFELAVSNLDQCLITYRFRIRTEALKKSVYPEMWCRVPGRGEFFSRGLHQQIRGVGDWSSVEIPFYLKTGQFPDLLKLNLVFTGPGVVRLKEIEIWVTPMEA